MIRKEKGRVDVYGDRFRARAHQLTPRLLQVARYIHDNREAVMEQTAMEIAAAPYRRWGSPGCAISSRHWSSGLARWSPPAKRCPPR